MRKDSLVCIALGVIFAGAGCSHKEPVQKTDASTFVIKGSVREMHIGLENPQFPDHDGKSEFVSYCSMCHSLKYISMQPNFPAKVWNAEVTKMIAKYKAPIDTVTGKKIAAYLVTIKGV